MFPPYHDPFEEETFIIGPYYTQRAVRRSPFYFTEREKHELMVATVILTLAFAIAFTGGLRGLIFRWRSFILYLVVAALAVITAFALHEIGHKFAAIHFGYWAEFNYFMPGLFIALFFSLAGFLFAAPGAVVIHGYPTRRENGIIAAAGPSVNLALGIFFFSLSSGLNPFAPLAGLLFYFVAAINILIGAFNMIPLPPLDGSKIIAWSLPVYLGMAVLLAIFLFFIYF